MDEYDPLLAAYNNGDGDQQAKPYALQVCNAGAMPESFEDWIKQGDQHLQIDDPGGNIIPSRVLANHDQYDKLPF